MKEKDIKLEKLEKYSGFIKFGTLLLFLSIMCSEFQFTHSQRIEKETFVLKSNFIELCSEFEFHFDRTNQMQELKLKRLISISTPTQIPTPPTKKGLMEI